MAIAMVIPFILLTIYAYSSDFQAQGRYILPMILPLCVDHERNGCTAETSGERSRKVDHRIGGLYCLHMRRLFLCFPAVIPLEKQ
ncbi:MAG: hypothetical protein ACLUUC_13860 [Fusicatenibacter saccharivorans]